MLVLTRKRNEKIRIGKDVYVQVVDVLPDNRVRLGITAPPDVEIMRTELDEREFHGHQNKHKPSSHYDYDTKR